MGKLTKYLLLLSGMLLLFYIFGLINPDDSGNIKLINIVTHPSTMNVQTIFSWSSLVTAAVSVAAGIIIGFYYFQGQGEYIIRVTISIFLFNFFWDILAIYNTIKNINGEGGFFDAFALITIAPLMFIWFIILTDWTGGKD